MTTNEKQSELFQYELSDFHGAIITGVTDPNRIRLNVPKKLLINGEYYDVKAIGTAAFANMKHLEKVKLPDTVEQIGDYAFYECGELHSVQLQDGLLCIGRSAFAKCTSLQEIIIPDTVTKVGDEAFCSCHEMRNVRYSAGAKEIPSRCFMWCTQLEEVCIPEGVTTIEDEAFTRCDSLHLLTLPDSVTDVWEDAFWRCDAKLSSNRLNIKHPWELKPLEVKELKDMVTTLEDLFGISADDLSTENGRAQPEVPKNNK